MFVVELTECMIHHCPSCPDESMLKTYLENELYSQDDNGSDNDSCIDYKQWKTTDRSELVIMTETIGDFIAILMRMLQKLTVHSYIAKSQAAYLAKVKNELNSTEVIVLGDFAENYQFVVQDEIQSFHWNKTQPCIQLLFITNQMENLSVILYICFISDDLVHDVDMIYHVMKLTVEHVKLNLSPEIETVHYFTDGCAGQYKNCKNFINICHHKHGFAVKCTSSFFATSHGKSRCDGIGGTVKRLTATASFHRTTNNQILTASAMFDFCQNEIKGIRFFYISKESNMIIRSEMEQRYILAKTLPGTQFYPFK